MSAAWSEDRATLGSDPSAEPGASKRHEGRAQSSALETHAGTGTGAL